MMRFMKRLLRLGMTMLLLLAFTAATALAAAETPTITVNVTNTPVRGDVLLEKTGLQLVRFEDEQDAYGNTVMRPVFQNGYLASAVFELRAAEDARTHAGLTLTLAAARGADQTAAAAALKAAVTGGDVKEAVKQGVETANDIEEGKVKQGFLGKLFKK